MAPQAPFRAPRFWPLLLALCANLVAIVTTYSFVESKERALDELETQRRATELATDLQAGLDRNMAALDSLAALFITHDEVEPTAFAHFIRAGAFPVHYVAPLDDNQAAHGFDLGSNPARKEALVAARDTGEVVCTAPIHLLQETEQQYGFLAFRPVYSGLEAPKSVESRRRALIGYALGVFRVGDMVDTQISHSTHSHDDSLWLMDETDADAPVIIHSRGPNGRPPDSGTARVMLDVPGRTWVLIIEQPDVGALGARVRARNLLALGIVYTLLLALVFGLYYRRLTKDAAKIGRLATDLNSRNTDLAAEVESRGRVQAALREAKLGLEERVAERTAELASANAQLARTATELERSNRDLSQFAYAASHDLRAPLRGIKLLAEFVAEDLEPVLTEQAREHIQLLEGRVERMDALLCSLLAYARSGATNEEAIELDPSTHPCPT